MMPCWVNIFSQLLWLLCPTYFRRCQIMFHLEVVDLNGTVCELGRQIQGKPWLRLSHPYVVLNIHTYVCEILTLRIVCRSFALIRPLSICSFWQQWAKWHRTFHHVCLKYLHHRTFWPALTTIPGHITHECLHTQWIISGIFLDKFHSTLRKVTGILFAEKSILLPPTCLHPIERYLLKAFDSFVYLV